MTVLSKSMLSALRGIRDYLADPMASTINRRYNRRTKAYTDKASHCDCEWFSAALEAGLVPGNFDLQRCWNKTSSALLRRGLIECVSYDWELRGEPMRSGGLRLTEAGHSALEEVNG